MSTAITVHCHRDLIRGECPDTYRKFAKLYFDFLQPRNLPETELVSSLISVRWRHRRAQAIEGATIDYALLALEPTWAETYEALPTNFRHMLAFHKTLNYHNPDLDLAALQHWEERLDNRFRRTLAAYLRIRGHNTLPTLESLTSAESILPNNWGLDENTLATIRLRDNSPDPVPASSVHTISTTSAEPAELRLAPAKPAKPAHLAAFDLDPKFIPYLMNKYPTVKKALLDACDAEEAEINESGIPPNSPYTY